jgi:hypothetical protein
MIRLMQVSGSGYDYNGAVCVDDIIVYPSLPVRLATIPDIGRVVESEQIGQDSSTNTFAFGSARTITNAVISTTKSLRINVNGTWYDIPTATVSP